jgi:hypothetical protein
MVNSVGGGFLIYWMMMYLIIWEGGEDKGWSLNNRVNFE